MNGAHTAKGARWRSHAVAICSTALPASGPIAHDPIAATAEASCKSDATGLTVAWRTGVPRKALAGPTRHRQAWIAARRLQAGPGFATAEIHGMRLGLLYVRTLMVAWIAGLTLVQIEAAFDGRPLSPGDQVRAEGLEVQVGRGAPDSGEPVAVSGLTVAARGEPVLRIAVVTAEPAPADAEGPQ